MKALWPMYTRLSEETAPATEPVTTAQAKTHMRVDISDDDTYIGTLITTARRMAEQFTGRSFIQTVWQYFLDEFPSDGDKIYLPKPNLISVDSIAYKDQDGNSQTLSSSTYQVITTGLYGFIALEPNESWPTTEDERFNAITIQFKAGYGDSAADVPQDIIDAIKIITAWLYENREMVTVGPGNSSMVDMPKAAYRILSAYRAWQFR